MWYNTQMKTKPKRYQSCRYRNDAQNIKTHNVVNPRERLMNTQKRQKLRDLLLFNVSFIKSRIVESGLRIGLICE